MLGQHDSDDAVAVHNINGIKCGTFRATDGDNAECDECGELLSEEDLSHVLAIDA